MVTATAVIPAGREKIQKTSWQDVGNGEHSHGNAAVLGFKVSGNNAGVNALNATE